MLRLTAKRTLRPEQYGRTMVKAVNSELVDALLQQQPFPHSVQQLELIETHISWIILTGNIAYKIKKPVDFGFLDFSSLEKRKQYCTTELILNSRSAPDIYLGLVPIYGSPHAPQFEPNGPIIEYAVKMRQFGSGQLFSELIANKQLSRKQVDQLAQQLSDFHQQIEPAASDSPYGEPEQVYAPMAQNFTQIRSLVNDPERLEHLQNLEAWTESTFIRLRPLLLLRKEQGFVRACHGDLHLGNITLFEDRVTVFDCIEFNEDFRWIDIISDIAFLVMDFEDQGAPNLGHRLLDTWLEQTGDYAGLRLLPFYKAYRAIVRAKIILLTLATGDFDADEVAQKMTHFDKYVEIAERCAALPNRLLLTMFGLSGTGKSTVAMRLVERLGMIRIRSDVERKRLFGFEAHHHSTEKQASNLYSGDATERTYTKLGALCTAVLDAGYSVVVDATNLKQWQRQCFQDIGDSRGVPVSIACCEASMSVIREWIAKRQRKDNDVSEADLDVVEKQIRDMEALTPEEQLHAFVIHSDILQETRELVSEIRKRFIH